MPKITIEESGKLAVSLKVENLERQKKPIKYKNISKSEAIKLTVNFLFERWLKTTTEKEERQWIKKLQKERKHNKTKLCPKHKIAMKLGYSKRTGKQYWYHTAHNAICFGQGYKDFPPKTLY